MLRDERIPHAQHFCLGASSGVKNFVPSFALCHAGFIKSRACSLFRPPLCLVFRFLRRDSFCCIRIIETEGLRSPQKEAAARNSGLPYLMGRDVSSLIDSP